MEYGLYLALVVFMVSVCCGKIWRLGRADRAERLAQQRQVDEDAASIEKDGTGIAVARSDRKKIPVPWGWPGGVAFAGGQDNPEISGVLQNWVDGLVSQKLTTDNRAYRKRCESSMRALLEDRFHSPGQNVNGDSKSAVRERRVARETGARMEKVFFEPIAEIRKPWGW